MLKFHLETARDRMKHLADRRRSDKVFKVGDLVYLKLQPYRQHIMKKTWNQKLAFKFYKPFPIETRVGKVACGLTLPVRSCIHATFHVSQLKKYVGHSVVQATLPIVDIDGAMVREPTPIINRRTMKKGQRAMTKILIERTNTLPEDAA